MKIKRLKLEKFRNQTNLELEPKDITILEGSNGAGKTSIKEAILFALYGVDMEGTNKGLDNQIQKGETSMAVTINIDDYQVIRKRSKAKSVVFYIDGSQPNNKGQVAQRDLESTLPDLELFRAVVDVGYFMSLSENDRKQLILKYSPEVDMDAIAAETYPWFPAMKEKYGIVLPHYTEERKRFMDLRREKQRSLNDATSVLSVTDRSDKDIEDQLKKAEKSLAKINADKPKVELCPTCNQALNSTAYSNHAGNVQKLEWECSRLRDTKRKQNADKDKLQQQVKELGSDIDDLTKVIDMLGPQGLPSIEFDVKLKPILEFVKLDAPKLAVKTLKEVKSTLEWKECFEVSLDGVPYARLSTGEKMKVDIIFSKMLDRLSGQQISLFFIDKVESITGKLPKLDGQIFLAKVTESETLTVKE